MSPVAIWLTGAAVYFVYMVAMMMVARVMGKWEIRGLDSAHEHVVHWLGLLKDLVGNALAWPLALLLVLIKWPTYSWEKLQKKVDDVAAMEPLQSGGFKMPPQDERSQAQLDDLDRRLGEELRASLGVSGMVKFYPLLRHSWLEFSESLPKEFPIEVTKGDAELYFLQFAQGFAKGHLK